jgi:hypothetical protein
MKPSSTEIFEVNIIIIIISMIGAMSIGLHLFDQENLLSQKHGFGYGFNSRVKPRALFHAIILQSNPLGYNNMYMYIHIRKYTYIIRINIHPRIL